MKRKQHPKGTIGDKFGKLTIVANAAPGRNGQTMFAVKCDCGVEKVMPRFDIVSGRSLSCGCSGAVQIKHGLYGHPLYSIYHGMIKRCTNPNTKRWAAYGGRGISVCEEWKTDVSSFISWSISNGWTKGKEIHRKNNDGNYEPSNCEWLIQSSHRKRHKKKRKPNHIINAALSFGS